ncbi:MAG: DUF2147 domain-containing protein [Deltaproteobacteria bacterium]
MTRHSRVASLIAAAMVFCLSLGAARVALGAPTPEGRWVTIDDDGKTASSVIEIYAREKKLYGKIVQLLNPREKDPKCTACEGPKKNQPILGMEILWGFESDGAEWSGGYILDPRNGKEYRCYLELLDGGRKLKVRGYVGIALFGRTQYWQRRTQATAR